MSASASNHAARTALNRKVMVDFIDLFFGRRRIREAFEKHAAVDYRQHSADFPDGREGTIRDLETLFATMPEASIDVRAILVDGDQAAVHIHGRRDAGDRGIVAVDMFRLEDDKIVDHRDAAQTVPEHSLNGRPVL